MRRTALAVLTAAAGGCSDSGPRKIVPAAPVAGDAPAEVAPAAARPAASDPAAVALVYAALDAHTGGDRAKVRQFASVEYARTGTVRGPDGNPLAATWAVACAWPDKFKVTAEFPGPQSMTVARTGAAGWKRAAGGPADPLGPVEHDDLRIDATGEWLWLLFPLIDPDTVLAPAPPVELAGKPAQGVRVFHPALSPAAVHFDPDTKLLARVSYDGREYGQAVAKVFDVVESKPYHGVKLAHRLAQTFRSQQYADWTLTRLDPRPGLGAAAFEPGK